MEASKFPITHTDGVITIEIIDCQPSDSGKYKCIATNSLGTDSTDCVVIVEGKYLVPLFTSFLILSFILGNNMSEEQKQMSDSILYSGKNILVM